MLSLFIQSTSYFIIGITVCPCCDTFVVFCRVGYSLWYSASMLHFCVHI